MHWTAGNVGIGTDTPVCALDVTGTFRATGNSTISGTLDIGNDVNVNSGKFTIAASTGNTFIAGNLQVDGTTTTVNSTELTVDDANIELASVNGVLTSTITIAAGTGLAEDDHTNISTTTSTINGGTGFTVDITVNGAGEITASSVNTA